MVAPVLRRYLFRNLFISSDLLASIRKSKGFVLILANKPTRKTYKQFKHVHILSPPSLVKAIA